MAARKENQINLLPQKGFSSTTRGRIVLWILSSFRVTVIVTEIIVIGAFLSRFYLDTRNSDLTDQIQERQAVIAASTDFENEFKETQEKLRIFSTLTNQDKFISGKIDVITKSLPPDLLLEEVAFGEKSAKITGVSPSEKSIQQLVVNLIDKNSFQEVSLLEIESKQDDPSLLEFVLDASYKEEEI